MASTNFRSKVNKGAKAVGKAIKREGISKVKAIVNPESVIWCQILCYLKNGKRRK